MTTRMLTTVFALVTALLAGQAWAAPTVPGFERFGRSSAMEPVEAGLLLLGELGCTNCHAATDQQQAHLAPARAPRLAGDHTAVGRRLQPDWIAAYLRDPHTTKPGTTMPQMLAGISDAERQTAAEAFAHFFAAMQRFDEAGVAGGGNARVDEGRRLYQQVGCQVCHGPLDGPATLPDQLPLVAIADRWSPAALDAFLADPLASHPAGRMPAVPLSDDQRRHIVAALVGGLSGGIDVPNVVAFNGRAWRTLVDALPDIDTLGEPDTVGPVRRFDLFDFAGVNEGVVIALDGFLHVPRAGTHRFFLSSDDGSRVLVGGKLVVDYDGIHPAGEQTGEIDLPAGVHPIHIDYFEAAGQEVLNLEIAPPGGPRQSSLALITPTADGTPVASIPADEPDVFTVTPELAAQGQAAFHRHGCQSCHSDVRLSDTLRVGTSRDWQALPLAALKTLEGGCLQAEPSTGLPDYDLDDLQRQALAAAIRWLASERGLEPPAPKTHLTRLLTSSNCFACHDRGGRGGVLPVGSPVDEDGEPILRDAPRDTLFASFVQELGDEGRLPPTLDGVGDKLQPAFLREVLREGGRDRRQTMATRMPAWQPELAEELAGLLENDTKTSVPLPALSGFSHATVVEQGRHLSGSRALGCIKCHSFAGEKGQSLGVIDMTRFPQRLRHEWFLAYVEDPQAFRPGTRMPASWPLGVSFYPDILDGTAAGQIEAVWQYVASASPRPPIGAGANTIELVASDRPVIYRNFIEGAGPRAIGVGYPERTNIAWDAETFRLALAWRNAFIDAGRHWTGRGAGWQPPLGDGVVSPDAAPAVAVLPDPNAPWPEAPPRSRGGRFLGYSLDDAGRPTFRWAADGLTVAEAIHAGEEDATPRLSRQFQIDAANSGGVVTVRAARGRVIEPAGDGWWQIDGSWFVRLSGDGVEPPTVITVDSNQELRAGVRPGTDRRSVFLEELTWAQPGDNQ
jgi:mono/diheme cytochrome c family protein